MTTELEAIIRTMQEQMTAQIHALQEALAQQNQAVLALSEEIATLKSAPGSPPKIALTAPNASDQQQIDTPTESMNGSGLALQKEPLVTRTQLSERLPDITEFTGRRSQLAEWKAALMNKLSGNSDRYPSELAKLTYARSCISGEPAVILGRLSYDFLTLQLLIAWLN